VPNNIIITPGSASIQFSGSANNDTIRLQVEASGSVAFYGNSGSLFSITDQLSGSLMSVNDISGLPILEVFSDDRVVMGTFNRNTLVVTGSRIGIDKAVPTADLDISGSVFITGSLRMNSGGITGSLFGTSSVATSASFAPTILPSGVVSSSGQVSYTGLSNIPSNIISSSTQVATLLPTGTVSSSTQINTGSFTGSFAGTLLGTASNATSASFAVSASWAPAASSGVTSITVSDGLSGGVITTTGTIRLDTGSVHFLDGVKKELNTEGVVSSSQQINTGSFSGSITTASFSTTSSFATSASFAPTILPSGVVSSSGQVSYIGLSNIPANIVSSSAQVVGLLPTGTVSSSIQINTGSFTGSFVGRFTGSLFGTASNATSASFAVSASWAPAASSGVTSITAGDGLSGGVITTTGTIRLDTGSVHFLDGVKKELNTEGVVSSSLQINTGSFSGSFTGVLGNKYTTLFGDGTATTFTITHNLNNISVLTQIVREASGSFVYPDITISGSNAITLEFTTAPATNEYRANVYGF
jgi:hypothetical protein